ncbi:hypothetical protein Pyrfu_0262 [Pyrolobus fumarii 1A]|uniref:H+transporting two-sector ATPase C (AC39) subunit n=1 Tax=Pyrolobus fumarii (strain DSM 11204 / 1A) TaxID=694429 RepID=G0EF91_PYRF1|nr:V-type ATPase subunit [Pyrolobus fumarii]AEM38134.1 hypothetical protein Pyrfu_0262 [Pyrolobus fumarii 1A]
MPFGYRGGSPAGYAAKLAAALGEAPGPEGIKLLLQSAYSFNTFIEALKSFAIAAWIEDTSSPRGIEIGMRRWLSTRIAQARAFASGARELINMAYSTYIAARDLTLLLRMAYEGEEPPQPDALAAPENPLVKHVYKFYLETRSFRGIHDYLQRTAFHMLPKLLDYYLKVEGANGIDAAIDTLIAWLFNNAYRNTMQARYYLCPRLDMLYARVMLNLAMRGAPREVIEEFIRLLRPCKLPDLTREASIGDPEAIMLKLRSTFYGEVTEPDMIKAFAIVENLIRREARKRAAMGIASNPLSVGFATAALEYLTLDLYDIVVIANGAFAGARPSEIAQQLSV